MIEFIEALHGISIGGGIAVAASALAIAIIGYAIYK